MALESSDHVGSPSRLRVGSGVCLVPPTGAARELTGKAALVLAWVALEGHVERRRLAAALWPQSAPGQARNNLRVLVLRINQRCGAELLVGSEQLALDNTQVQPELHDADVVLSALRAGGPERCELLASAGLEADAGEELQAWLESARQRVQRAQLAGLSEALVAALAAADHPRAVSLAQACVLLDPLSEHRHRQLMDVLARSGDRAAALAAYESCRQLLKRQLGVLPDLRTRTVHLRILQEQAQDQPPEQPAAPAQDHAAAQSPEADGLTPLGGAARYPLVEREALLTQARAALAQGVHVVLHGEPGVGKTRLLRHLAVAGGTEVEAVALRSGLLQEPYAAVAQLLQQVQLRRTPRVGVPEQIELARLAPLAFAGVKPSEAALSAPRLHAALRHWLARLAQAGLRVLVLDDVHNADAASQAAFGALLAPPAPGQGPEEPAVALLLGLRSGEVERVLDEALVAAQVQHRARSFALPRLSLDGVLSLLRSMDMGRHAPQAEALAQQLLRRTGGNPLFVIELARQSLERGEAADMASLQALLGSRLKGCSVAAQQLAAVAAVAAEDFTVELAVAVVGLPALGLMPAWGELQERGLFAGHGLAHDLVRDAVLAGLPQAILKLLHRQAAQHLEAQGLRGAAVLRHWLAAEDADHALPHAAHQMYTTSAAGLNDPGQELQVLDLLERCSDTLLMDSLWLTADISATTMSANSGFPEAWGRLRALRQRVERLPPRGTSQVWIAFEAARDHYWLGKSAWKAYETLAPMLDRLPEAGVERAWAELAVGENAIQVTGAPAIHFQRARSALASLPDHLSMRHLRRRVDDVVDANLDPVLAMRSMAARLRGARRRRDFELMAQVRLRMAYVQAGMGNGPREFNHLCRAAVEHPVHAGPAQDLRDQPFTLRGAALRVGHFDLAHRLLLDDGAAPPDHESLVLLALLQLRIGDPAQAARTLARVEPERLLQQVGLYFLHARTSADLDFARGLDPLPALIERLGPARRQELGIGGVHEERFAWELTRRSRPAAERIEAGHALLASLRQGVPRVGMRAIVSIEVAEAHAEAGVPGSAGLAAEAGHHIRRGYTPITLYLPEGLLRCARLLRPDDNREAAALVHVARRWVHNALRHLPPGAERGFVDGVPVNRLLLCGDEQAVFDGALQ